MIWFVLYAATVVAANWAIQTYGLVPVGFGLLAPAGVYFAGFAFGFRDLLQDSKGKGWSVAAIGAGIIISLLVSPSFALASAAAFGVSELLDFAVYTPLRKRGWLRAVAASNAVGLTVDSVVFLGVAFGSLDFVLGQVVGKAWITLAFVAGLAVWRWSRSPLEPQAVCA